MKAKSVIMKQKWRHRQNARGAATALHFSPHEYLKPLGNRARYCERCARRTFPCLKCSYCFLCHPFKEDEERAARNHNGNEVDENTQTRLSSFVSLEAAAT